MSRVALSLVCKPLEGVARYAIPNRFGPLVFGLCALLGAFVIALFL